MSKEEETDLLLYSESFPLDENKERKKMKPIAECHKLLKDVKIDPSQIIYKPLTPENVDEVKKLHQEWFPVKYEDEFFNRTLINNNGQYFSVAAFYSIQSGENEYKEVILGLIICQWVYVDPYFFKMTNKKLAKEITESLNFEEEAKLFLYHEKFYHAVYIMSLGVIDECRKMGIATSMLKSIYNYSIYYELCVGVYLNVITDNYSGKKFYEKNGMVLVNNIKDFYVIEDKKYDCDVYVKLFTRKEKDLRNKQAEFYMTFKQKLYKKLILRPFYFLIKLYMLIFWLQCCRNSIKTEE